MKSAPKASKDIRLVLQQVTAAAANLPIVGSPPEVTPNFAVGVRRSGSKPTPKARQRVVTKPASAKKAAARKKSAPANKAAAKKKPAASKKATVKKPAAPAKKKPAPTRKKVASKGKKR